MAAGGGYNAPNLADTSTSFGSEAAEAERSGSVGGGGGISSQPLFGVDYKRYGTVYVIVVGRWDILACQVLKYLS